MSNSETIKNFTENNPNLLYNNKKKLERYSWDTLLSNDSDRPKVVDFCKGPGKLGKRAKIDHYQERTSAEIDELGCVSVPGNPFYAPTPQKHWDAETAQRSMPWLLGPGESVEIGGKTVNSFMDNKVEGICSGTSAFVGDKSCAVGIIDGHGNIEEAKDWKVTACKNKDGSGGESFDRKETIKQSYGEDAITSWQDIGKGEVKPLLFGGDEDKKKPGELLFVKNNKGYIPPEVIAVHKTWGQVQPNLDTVDEIDQAPNGTLGDHGKKGGWFNGGILAENITVSKKPVTVNRKVPNIRGDTVTKQHVIELSTRGDFYDSTKHNTNVDKPIQGIYKNFTKEINYHK